MTKSPEVERKGGWLPWGGGGERERDERDERDERFEKLVEKIKVCVVVGIFRRGYEVCCVENRGGGITVD